MKKKTKRTPEEAQAAVEEAKKLVKGGMTVEEALKRLKLQPSTWYKYKGKRKPYAKSSPSVSEVLPIEGTDLIDVSGGARRFTIITNDPAVIDRFLGGL